MRVVPVILCGGAGARMWPASRASLPKQFIPFVGDLSTFQRARLIVDDSHFDAPIVVTNESYGFIVREQLSEIGLEAGRIVLEPCRRDSAPAIAVACEIARNVDPDAVVVALAADHVIDDRDAYRALCLEATRVAGGGRIATLGIRPTRAATQFGYLRPGAPIDGSSARLLSEFVEKPDSDLAERLIAEGCLWNSGDFAFRADVLLEELAAFEPVIAARASAAAATLRETLGCSMIDPVTYEDMPRNSIDYAVMERTTRGAVIPADISWSDIGSWDAVWRLSSKDDRGNSVRGDGLVQDASNVHIHSQGVLTTVVGVDDAVVVATGDTVLVVDRRRASEVRGLVEQLGENGRREATEHRRSYRPWGHFQTIDFGVRHQVKRIVVKPGARLSLQRHRHRAEHWIVVKGQARVERNGETLTVAENQSIYHPAGTVHRLANESDADLELIEVQTGEYFGEDDILRLDDDYGRA